MAARSLRTAALIAALLLLASLMVTISPRRADSAPAPASSPAPVPGPSIISSIDHELRDDRTRIVIKGNRPIDYRGGVLMGEQVILDLANVTMAIDRTVVEIGTAEVARVVIGPEITRDGAKVLKLRLTGVHASLHKVERRGSDLLVDLISVRPPGKEKGLPKIIRNDAHVVARATNPLDAQGDV